MKVKIWSVVLIALSLLGCGASGTDSNGTSSPARYTVSGVISASPQPTGGFKVDLTDGATTVSQQTDVNGKYSFAGLLSGTYGVKPTHVDYTFGSAADAEKILPNIKSDVVLNFTATAVIGSAHPATHTVRGTITLPNPLPTTSVSVQLTNIATNATSAVQASTTDGTYLMSGVEASGTYDVRPSLSEYMFNPDVSRITNIQRDQILNFTASKLLAGGSISGRITQSNVALPGVSVTLKNTTSPTVTAIKPTDANGNYTFSGLSVGTYTVTPSASNVKFTPEPSPSQQLIINNTNTKIVQNFTAQTLAPGGAVRNYTLYIQAGSLTIIDKPSIPAARLPAWGFTDVNGDSPKFPGPQLNANAGDTVNVTVINNHTIPHNFVIQGATSATPELIDSKTVKYSFIAVKAGSYLYYDSLNSSINREMGLYGALIVGSSDGSQNVWDKGPAYTFQRIWILSEMDKSRWNNVASSNGTVSTDIYKPNYFLMNGQGGFEGVGNPATTIAGKVGETALVRIINAGQFTNSLHFHGNHIKVLTVNGVQQSSVKELDVISIPPMGTADVLYDLIQAGEYPMHNHIAQMETSNGTYLNGIVTMISIK